MTFFGYAGPNAKARKELVGLIWNLTFGLAQFVIIIVMLVISGVRKSPRNPALSEWDACEKPLGAWNCIWLVRVVLGVTVSYWGFKRERAQRLNQERRENTRDVELGRTALNHPNIPPPGRPPQLGRVSARNSPTTPTSGQTPPLPHSYLYSRLSLLTSVLSLVWFLTAHILEYTSVNSCRFSAPHLWWLTFGILCILYLMVLEIFLLGLLVFILGPVIYLAYSLILLCLGRHPMQNPPIKPEIGKLPQSVVDQIPLVLYIPAPPEDEKAGSGKGGDSPITVPSPVYSYPPKSPSGSSLGKKNKMRFAFLRGGKTSRKGGSGANGDGDDVQKNWEDDWEPGEYPFVRMEGHRATCAICLMDFDEPPRVNSTGKKVEGEDDPVPESSETRSPADGDVEEVQVGEVTLEDRTRIQLEDAGEGPQPLRLLMCGHAFHKTCIDPWLTGMSGRCPTCQRPIEVPDKTGKKKGRRNERTGSP